MSPSVHTIATSKVVVIFTSRLKEVIMAPLVVLMPLIDILIILFA